MNEPIRILIVDDSALVRRALREMLESDPIIQVVGEAANGRDALKKAAELRPNVITMDVRMPIMDGFQTTEQLMAYNPTPVLAVTALYSKDDIDISFKMLGSGALEVMEKPDISDPMAYERARRELVQRVKLLSRVRVVTHLRGRRRFESANQEMPEWSVKRTPPPTPPKQPEPKNFVAKHSSTAISTGKPITRLPEQPTPPPLWQTLSPPPEVCHNDVTPYRPHLNRLRFPVVVIGASTGGPRIVQQILKNLQETFNAAVLVVQHIAEGFSVGMVEWLAENCKLPVRLAKEGDKIQSKHVLVAPDSFHLFVKEDGTVQLDQQPMLQRPSVDVTMQTAAQTFGLYTTGVLLTGMGRDGAIGMQKIHLAGGYTIAQDETSCSIYGMPRAAVELNVVDDILPPEGIIQVLNKRFGESI